MGLLEAMYGEECRSGGRLPRCASELLAGNGFDLANKGKAQRRMRLLTEKVQNKVGSCAGAVAVMRVPLQARN
jgi:hypothetical protein